MRFDVTVKNRKGMVANFMKADSQARNATVGSVQKFGEDVRQLTYQLAPKDTWFMANHVEDRYSPAGTVVTVGWWAEDFVSQGLNFYPPFVEYGTTSSPAQPSLGPAYEALSPFFTRDIAREMKNAFRRAAGRF